MRFRPVGSTEKKWGADYEQLLRAVFSCFQGHFLSFLFLKLIMQLFSADAIVFSKKINLF